MIKKSHPLLIKDIISRQNSPLLDLYSRTIDIANLQKKLYKHLPVTIRENVTVASYNNLTLNLFTHNAAWATRLRFKIPEIMDIARNECLLHDLQTIRIKVAPVSSELLPTKKPNKISTKTAKLLKNTGETIADPQLRDAFIRLSQNQSG